VALLSGDEGRRIGGGGNYILGFVLIPWVALVGAGGSGPLDSPQATERV